MSIEEIQRTVQAVAANQDRHDQAFAEINAILHNLADRQIVTDERFAELAAAQLRGEERSERLEIMFSMLEELTKDTRDESNERMDRIDERLNLVAEHLDALTLSLDQTRIGTNERMDRIRDESNERRDRIDERLSLVAEHLDSVTLRLDGVTVRIDNLTIAQAKNEDLIKSVGEQIGALTAAQARTDERINRMLARNGDDHK